MDKYDIIGELDRLALKIALDEDPKKSYVERFEQWVKNIQGQDWHSVLPFYPTKWAEYKNLKSLVEQLHYDKHSGTKAYAEDKRKTRELIAEIVAMVMFIEDEKDESHKR